MDPSPGRNVVDFPPGVDPIAGHVRAHDQNPRAFTGWTGLVVALREATGEDGHRNGAPDGAVTQRRAEGMKR